MFYDYESRYLNLDKIYTHEEEDCKHVEGFDIVPPNFDFSFGSTHCRNFLSVKNIFIDTHYQDINEIQHFDANNKLVTLTYYNRAGMNNFLKNILTNEMHLNIIYHALLLSKLDLTHFVSIKDIQHLVNKIYMRYYYVYSHNLMPPGQVREFNSEEGRIRNYKNRMNLILQNFHENTMMDWELNNPKNLILLKGM